MYVYREAQLNGCNITDHVEHPAVLLKRFQ